MNRFNYYLKKLFNHDKLQVDSFSPEVKVPPFKSRMKHFESYFERNIKNDKLFEVNLEAIKEINRYALKDEVTEKDLKQIVKVYNDTTDKEHHGGTGWHDVMIHIKALIRENGYLVETTKEMKVLMMGKVPNKS